VIDNRPGASSIVGTEIASRADHDGYTLLSSNVTFAINSSMYSKLRYDALQDFEPVTLMATVTNILVLHPTLAATSIKDLIALAKPNAKPLNYASAGNGTATHLAMELFKNATNMRLVHVPYKGDGPAVTALLAGEVQLMFANLPPALPHVKAGRLKALAITSAKRSPFVPELPTVAESGFADFEATSWFGVVAPAKTPRGIITTLNAEINRILKMPDVREFLSDSGADPGGSTPEQYGAFIRAETIKWAKVVKDSGARVD
jgi:tripartite-type tricarboxylate transporter receptor subunit TctC